MFVDDYDYEYASESECDQFEALTDAADHPDKAWLISGRDVAYLNPFYDGRYGPANDLHPEAQG